MSLPTIGITMGDAAGISPEILVKSLADPAIRTFCEPVVLGDVRVLAAAAKTAGLDLAFRTVERPSDWRGDGKAFAVVDYHDVDPATVKIGMAVEVVFRDVSDTIALPLFKPRVGA